MHKLTATFRIVTPMFIAGANQQKAELRAPSIKGALRFWWRALNWAQIRQGSANEQEALEKLKEEEGRLFGDADDAGQSAVLISLFDVRASITQMPPNLHAALTPDHNNANKMAGARYLGYGVVEFSGGRAGALKRACIVENQSFSIHIAMRNHDDSILDALKLLGLLGGLGSRVRRGYGSLVLSEIVDEENEGCLWKRPENMEAYKKEIQKVLATYQCGTLADLPPFSAFYQGY